MLEGKSAGGFEMLELGKTWDDDTKPYECDLKVLEVPVGWRQYRAAIHLFPCRNFANDGDAEMRTYAAEQLRELAKAILASP